MGADPGFARAQHAGARRLKLIARGEDILDLVADVVNAARGVLFEEAGDGRALAQRVQQFDLGVRKAR